MKLYWTFTIHHGSVEYIRFLQWAYTHTTKRLSPPYIYPNGLLWRAVERMNKQTRWNIIALNYIIIVTYSNNCRDWLVQNNRGNGFNNCQNCKNRFVWLLSVHLIDTFSCFLIIFLIFMDNWRIHVSHIMCSWCHS